MRRDPLLIELPRPAVTGRVEIARSFSFKLNLGNFQSADFFCSQKAECAIEDAEQTSEALYQFCRSQVLKAVNETRRAEQGFKDPTAKRKAS